MKNPYEVLGISPSATMDDVKRAYREKARQFSDNQAKMDELNDAYDYMISKLCNSRGDSSYSDNTSTERGG